MMPIYTLTIQIKADVEADSPDAAQEAALDHFVEQFEESEAINVESINVVRIVESPEVEDEFGIDSDDITPMSKEEFDFWEQEYQRGPEDNEPNDVY